MTPPPKGVKAGARPAGRNASDRAPDLLLGGHFDRIAAAVLARDEAGRRLKDAIARSDWEAAGRADWDRRGAEDEHLWARTAAAMDFMLIVRCAAEVCPDAVRELLAEVLSGAAGRPGGAA